MRRRRRRSCSRSPAIADEDLPRVVSNLAGHDLPRLLEVLAEADAVEDAPVVVFAYTIKGFGLPLAGDPLNHSMLLTQTQMDELRVHLGVPEDDIWAAFPPDSPEGLLVRGTGRGVLGAADRDRAAAARPRSSRRASAPPTRR